MSWRTNYIRMANIQPSSVVAVQSKAWVYGRSLPRIAGSNPAKGIDLWILWVLCIVHVRACATGWSLVQRSHIVCVSLSMITCNSQLLHLRWGGTISRTKKRTHVQLSPRPTVDKQMTVLQTANCSRKMFFRSWSTSVAFRRSVKTNSNEF